MRFQCPFCSYTLRGITHSMLGRKVQCPDCNKKSHLPKDEFAEGRVIGDFILKRRLGSGSIGQVFLAHQISLDRPVALKVLSSDYSNTKGIEAFLKEARAAAQLSHPNLVQSFGVGEEEGVCFMAMNFIEGETVKDKIEREGKIKVDEALHITQQVAEGLHYAWSEAGLIHRDVKPENIMITKDGAVKLTDLGLAMTETEWHEDMEISGSPSYMSPEQFTGEKLDTRSDIYSLGISLYQMLSGELPFQGRTLKTVAKQHFHEASKPLHKLDPMIPLKVSQLVQKMIAKEPSKRFQNMEELIREIWEVRQRTAPDKDLIPSVHTISIKRLDYSLQKLSEKHKQHVAEELENERKILAKLKPIAFVTVIVLIAILITYFITQHAVHKSNLITESKVLTFEELMQQKNLEPDALMKEWLKVKEAMNEPKTDFERELHTRMDLMKAEIEIKSLEEKIRKLQAQSQSVTVKHSQELQHQIEKNRQFSLELKKKEAELQKREKLFEQREALYKQKIRSAVVRTSAIKARLGKSKEELRAMITNQWKNDVRIKLLGLIAKQKFKEATAFLKVEEEKHPDRLDWIEKRNKELEELAKLYNAFSMSGSTYAGVEIEEGIVKSILADKVKYIKEDGSIEETTWSSLDPESLVRIAFKVFPDEQENTVRTKVYKLIGAPIMAAKFAEDKETQAQIDAVCEYKMDMIRRLLYLDKPKAKEAAMDFLKQLSVSPKRKEKYYNALIKLF